MSPRDVPILGDWWQGFGVAPVKQEGTIIRYDAGADFSYPEGYRFPRPFSAEAAVWPFKRRPRVPLSR